MDFDLISFILGGVTGFIGAAAMGRAKFNSVQRELRDTRDAFLDALHEVHINYLNERDINEGLQAELHDAAVPKAKRIN